MSFREAVELLAERYDVLLRSTWPRRRRRGPGADDKRSRALLAHQLAAEFYQSRLRTADAAPCATLLRGRYGARSALANRFALARRAARAAELTRPARCRPHGRRARRRYLAAAVRPKGRAGRRPLRRPSDDPDMGPQGRGRRLWRGILDGAGYRAGSFEEAKHINSAERCLQKRETLYGAHLARDAGAPARPPTSRARRSPPRRRRRQRRRLLGTALTTQLLAAAAPPAAARLNLNGDEAQRQRRLLLARRCTRRRRRRPTCASRRCPKAQGPGRGAVGDGVDEHIAGGSPAVGWVEWLVGEGARGVRGERRRRRRLRRCAAVLQGLVAKAPTAAARAHHARRLARARRRERRRRPPLAARVEAELLAPAPRRPPPPSRPGAAPLTCRRRRRSRRSVGARRRRAAKCRWRPFVWTSAGGGGALPALHWMNSTCGRAARPATLAEPPRCRRARSARSGAPAARRRPPSRPRACPRGTPRCPTAAARAPSSSSSTRCSTSRSSATTSTSACRRPSRRPTASRRRSRPSSRAARAAPATKASESRARTPARRLLQQLAADVAGEAPAEELWACGASSIGGAGDAVGLAELRAPSDALADASAWAARAARRDAEMEILEREMRGGNAGVARRRCRRRAGADGGRRRGRGGGARRRHAAAAASPPPSSATAPPAPRRRAEALDLAAVRAAMPLDGAAVPGLAEDCSAIADELEAEAEEAGGGRRRGVGGGGHRRGRASRRTVCDSERSKL